MAPLDGKKRPRSFAIMPNVEGATIAPGTVATAKRIANRIVAARFAKNRRPMYGPEFQTERDACLETLQTWPNRKQAEVAASNIDATQTEIEPSEQIISAATPPQRKGPQLHELKMNEGVKQLAVPRLSNFRNEQNDLLKKIQTENEKTGSHNWKILQGNEGEGSLAIHVSSGCVSPGELLQVHAIHNIGSNVHFELYRMGWYSGRGGIMVHEESVFIPEGEIWGLDLKVSSYGNRPTHPVAISWRVPTDVMPGFYLVKAIDTEGKSVLHPFWVRSTERIGRTVLLSPELSLQCSNWWGGANALGTWSKKGMERFTDSKGRFPLLSNRHPMPEGHSLSMNRPFFNARAGDAFRAYLNLIRWLERNGVLVNYLSDLDIYFNPSILDGYDRIIIPPSMRFWTPELHQGLAEAKMRGVDIISFGSSAGTRKVIYDEENKRILIDADEEESGGQFNDILHTMHGGWGQRNNDKEMEFIQSEKSELVPGLRGLEWDFFNPESITEDDEVTAVAKLDGEIVSHLVRHQNGSITFNAGTLNWSWALDELGQHGALNVHEGIQDFTLNLISKASEGDSEHPDVLVSIVMTAYKVADIIEDTIHSILAQTHTNFELIIVDDASPDNTFQIILQMAKLDDRIKPLRMIRNRGTYYAKNYGIAHASGVFVTTQDADDTSHPHRISTQINTLMRNSNAVACACDYSRRDENANLVLNRGLVKRLAYQALFWRREEVEAEIGYFDSVRAAADDEFVNRIRLVFGRKGLLHIPISLYDALDREGSLTNDPKHRAMLVTRTASKDAHLSEPRKIYVTGYQKWHDEIAEGASPRMPYPLTRRKFHAPPELQILTEDFDQCITVSMASFPPRKERMLRVVESLLPQVDQMNIYLNEYEEVPEELIDERINVVLGKDGAGDLRDNGKFYFLNELKHGYHLTVDDDIIYPPDYIQKLILKIEQYNRQALVGVHGVIFDQPIERFFKGRTVYGFYREQVRDAFVNLIGTGTLAYHTDTIQLNLSDFTEHGMADVFVAIQAKQSGIPIICVKRPMGWLEAMDSDEEEGDTLWDEFQHADHLQTALVQAESPWDTMVYTSEFTDWVGELLANNSLVALALHGYDVSRMAQIGLPESTGPVPVGLRSLPS